MNRNAATDRHRPGKRRGQFTCFRPESGADPERARAETSKLSPHLHWRRDAMNWNRATGRYRNALIEVLSVLAVLAGRERRKRRGPFTCFRPESAADPERAQAETSKLSPEPDLR